jgi:hypothetical protein
MDSTYEFILEPDFDITRINMYRELISHFSFRQFTPPYPTAYFDGAYIVYAVIAAATGKLASYVQWLRDLLPNSDGYGLFAAELTNATATTLAGWVFYRSMIRLGTGAPMGFLLALLLCLSPQLLHINLIRIDHFILLPLVTVFHVSLMIALVKARQYHAIALGLAMALLVNLKLSCVVFAAFPALAVAALLARQRDYGTMIGLGRFAVAAGVPFIVVATLLMARYLALGPTGFLHHCLMSIEEVQKWTAVLPSSPRFYYNVDLFSDYGTIFLVIAGASAAITLAHAIVTRHPVSLFLTTSLVLFSVLGIMAFKYQRGGYHLIPIYLAEIGFVVALVRSQSAGVGGVRRPIASTVMLGVLAIPASNAWAAYEDERANVAAREVAIDRTRRQPRNWLAHHVPPDSKICLMRHSDWASVPMQGLPLRVTYGPLDFPYLDREALVRYPIPSVAEFAAQCDIAVLNNFHKSMYAVTFRRMGLNRKWKEWEELFEKTAQAYPPIVFTSSVPAHGVSRIEIYDLRAAKRPAT